MSFHQLRDAQVSLAVGVEACLGPQAISARHPQGSGAGSGCCLCIASGVGLQWHFNWLSSCRRKRWARLESLHCRNIIWGGKEGGVQGRRVPPRLRARLEATRDLRCPASSAFPGSCGRHLFLPAGPPGVGVEGGAGPGPAGRARSAEVGERLPSGNSQFTFPPRRGAASDHALFTCLRPPGRLPREAPANGLLSSPPRAANRRGAGAVPRSRVRAVWNVQRESPGRLFEVSVARLQDPAASEDLPAPGPAALGLAGWAGVPLFRSAFLCSPQASMAVSSQAHQLGSCTVWAVLQILPESKNMVCRLMTKQRCQA